MLFRFICLVCLVNFCGLCLTPAWAQPDPSIPPPARETPPPARETPPLASEGARSPSRQQIQTWVAELDADRYEIRKRATDQLTAAGRVIVHDLADAIVETDSVELQTRAFQILGRIAVCGDEADEAAAHDALERVSQRDAVAALRARVALQSVLNIYKERAIERLGKLGAQLKPSIVFVHQTQLDVYSLRIDERWKGKTSDLRLIRMIKDLREIELQGEMITDEFLEPLAGLTELQAVTIRRARVTDEGFAKLKGSPIQVLRVWYSPITDASLDTLLSLKNAQAIQLFGTRISRATADVLKDKLFGVQIDHRHGGFLGVGPQLGVTLFPGQGCVINRPQEGSAAEKAGLLAGDTIVKYNGKKVTDFESLKDLISFNAPGDKIEIVVSRDNQDIMKTVQLGEWPQQD